ncbi:MAG: class I SAM-dependent RNA methyltransferase [Chloroflexi bacterium]|nr:class I SAM-dependent RNA methyltransferase [Chloroflexota bacterium]
MTQGGEAMGRDETGRVVFVPYAIAGEEVVAEIIEAKKNFARARLVEIVTPSPARVTPRCRHFAPHPLTPSPDELRQERGKGAQGVGGEVGCGGCQWQHIAYDAQLEFKRDIVREQFARIGKLPDAPVRDAIGMTEPWRYRNNAQFQLDAEGRLCLRALESHQLVRIAECHIIHPLLDEMFRALEFAGADFAGVTLRAGTQTGQKLLILEGNDDEPPELEIDEPVSVAYQVPSGETVALIGQNGLEEKLGGRVFHISPASFFQVNTTMAEKLVALVEQYLAPRPSDTLLDAFGGVGTFGLSLASHALKGVAKVIEIEANPYAVDDARANASDLSNVEFHVGAVEDVLPKLDTPIDLVVADPPRAGIAPRALDAIIACAPRALAYVSCDPATLARDARKLVDAGYRLREVQPMDLFPHTYHIESVSWFERVG